MDLTDAQWALLEPLFRPKRRDDGRGRPWQDTRAVLNGVFWVLRTGAPWHDLPRRYPPYQTCHRRFQQWQRSGLLTKLLQKLAEDLRDRGKLDLSESFIDASFSSAKKGALLSALLAAAKAAKSWRSATAMVFLSPCTWSALRHMKRLSSKPPSSTIPRRNTGTLDWRQGLRQRSAGPTIRQKFGVVLIAPHRWNRSRNRHAGRSRTAALSPPLENRTPVRLASQLSSRCHSLGILPREFPRDGSTRLAPSSS